MKKIFLSLFSLAAIVASAQKVSSKLSFQKGQTLEVTTNMNMTTQSMMGEMPANIITTDVYAVGEASPAQVQLTKTPKHMKASFSMMGQDMNIDSDNPKDMEGQFGEPIKEAMKLRQAFTIDATGLVTAVKADDKKSASEGAGAMGMMMPGMNGASAMAVVGQPSVFKILPAYEVGKGDTWTDSTNADGNASKTVYTVKDITDKEILLDFAGESKVKTSQSMMGMSANVSSNTKNTGTITVDKATGLLKQKTITANTESNINAGGQELSTSTKATIVVTVKPV